ncbi:MAG TPA: glycosyltransferase [Acidobacteriaceae bacterium]|jgi:glycosyltransferase involved in cell wall biosynthesis|nr:glycosyltransferase [Acidobacteriaceae bacterium]
MDADAPILHLIASGFYGGPEKQILCHVRMLRASGIDGRIGSFEENGKPELLKFAERANIPTIYIPQAGPFGEYQTLVHELRRNNVAALCTHGFNANVLGYFACKRTGITHIAFVRGWTAETPKVRFYEMLDRWILRRTRHVVCVARPQAEFLMQHRIHLPAPHFVPNAALPPPHDASVTSSMDPHDEPSLPPNAFVLGAIGRLSVEKGHADLLDAVALLTQTTPEISFHLLLLGEGREHAALKQRAIDADIHDRVHFLGFRRDVHAWLKRMDCLVQPSYTEGTPNSILEAMLAGTPIISTSVGGVPDLIEHGRSGLLVSPHAPAELAQAIRQLAISTSLRREISASATARLQAFSPEAHFQKMMAVYQEALDLRVVSSEVHA